MRIFPKSRWARVALALVVMILASIPGFLWWCIGMPGHSFTGEAPELTPEERELENRLRSHIERLASEIPQRDVPHIESLDEAADFLVQAWREAEFEVATQTYEVDGETVRNLEVEIPGHSKPDEILIVGAHYDSAHGWPGADDNASGVAGVLELSRAFRDAKPVRTLRFVAFVNEEPPYFQTEEMGSVVYAKRCKERGENIVGMLSLETIAYFRDEPGTQQYPSPLEHFYGDRGNFIGFVGDTSARSFVRKCLGLFRESATIPSDGIAAPDSIPGIGWSDHWSFSREGYPALMVTDTAPFRNPHYHTPEDTPEKLDYESLTRVIVGVREVLETLANE